MGSGMTKWKRHHVNIQVGFYTKCFFAELLGPSSNKALFIRLLKASDLKKKLSRLYNTSAEGL